MQEKASLGRKMLPSCVSIPTGGCLWNICTELFSWQLEMWQWDRGDILGQITRFGYHQHLEAMNINESLRDKRERTRRTPGFGR